MRLRQKLKLLLQQLQNSKSAECLLSAAWSTPQQDFLLRILMKYKQYIISRFFDIKFEIPALFLFFSFVAGVVLK